jgi:hypothetical protein
MKKVRPGAESPLFLSGWKEIATYLNKGVRTVQRYERQMGLPVRRPAGRVCGSVVAVKAELDGWVKASPIREVFHLRSADPAHSDSAQALRRGLSELSTLRNQLRGLHIEVRDSVERLRDTLQLLQGELIHGEPPHLRSKFDSEFYSQQEHDLLNQDPTIATAVRFSNPS